MSLAWMPAERESIEYRVVATVLRVPGQPARMGWFWRVLGWLWINL